MHRDDMDGLTRRGFLRASCGAGAAAALAATPALTWAQAASAATTTPGRVGDGILVIVTLYGGNDGLSAVVPYANSTYQQARGKLAYDGGDVHPLGEGLGLNPAMSEFKALWDDGRLAIVRGAGYPEPDRSHFRSMDIWQTGSPETPVRTGWIGRWLDATGADPLDDALRALNIGTTIPPLLVGERLAGSTIGVGGMAVPEGNLATRMRAMNAAGSGVALQRAAASSARALFTAAAQTNPVVTTSTLSASGFTGTLGAQLEAVSKLIRGGLPTRVYSVSLSGFDTHADERGQQERALGQVSSAVGAFMRSIASSPRADDVTVMVYSEFGRRVAANESQGTDHGTSGPAFVIGNTVRGGFVGEQPSLDRLEDGDLAVTTDFRSLYATLLERVLGTDPTRVLGPWSGRLRL